MIGGIIGAVIGAIIGVIFVRRISRRQKQRSEQGIVPTAEPFVASEYLARIERVALDIEREKREKAPTIIVLWLLLDGLQINADGSFEWIKRERDIAGEGGCGGYGTLEAKTWSAHPPYIGQNGNWFVYNSPMVGFVDSGFPYCAPAYLQVNHFDTFNVAQSLASSRAVMLSQLCDARANLEAQRINALSALNTCTITQQTLANCAER